MKRGFILILLTFLALLCTSAAYCAPAGIFPLISVPDQNDPINVDGKADEPFWAKSADMGPFGFIDAMGIPPYETTARVSASNDELRFFISCDYPDMTKVNAIRTARDSDVWQDECIEIFVTAPDGKYRHFVVNPLAAQFDELLKDVRWNADWKAATINRNTGWDLEVAIPWKAFNGKPKAGDVWRFNIGRSTRFFGMVATISWSPVTTGFHRPDRFGYMKFGAKSWVSSAKWCAREPGSKPASLDVTLSGSSTGIAARLGKGSPASLVADTPVSVIEEPGVEGYRNTLLSVDGKTQIARLIYGVRSSPIDEILIRVQKRIQAIKTKNPNIASVINNMKSDMTSMRKAAKNADAETIASLEKKAIDLDVRSSSLKPLIAMLESGNSNPRMAYGVEISLLKILKIDPFKGQAGGRVTFSGAKGEVTAAQLALFTYDEAATGIKCEFSDLVGPSGKKIPASRLRARQVGYVETKKPSYSVRYVGLWPDPLLPTAPFDMKANSREIVWLDVKIPYDAAPGLYKGIVKVVGNSQQLLTVPVTVKVWGFALPKQNHIFTAFGGGGNEAFKLSNDAVWDNMLEHRISAYNCVGSPKLITPAYIDWSKYTEARITVKASYPGSVDFNIVGEKGLSKAVDFNKGEQTITIPLAKENISSITRWSISLRGVPKGYLKVVLVGSGTEKLLTESQMSATIGENGLVTEWPMVYGEAGEAPDKSSVWDWTEFDANMQKRLPQGLTAFTLGASDADGWKEIQRHLGKNDWLDMEYTYLMDEPEPVKYPEVNNVLGTVNRLAPGIHNMMTARSFPKELKFVDIWCPEIFSYDPVGAKAEQAKGRTVWWYTAYSTRRPYVNLWVDYPALDNRIWPWITWKHHLDGMLYWSICYWALNNPWECAMTFPGANGDGSMIYPGKNGDVVDSLRWECLRDGMQDYEVFCLLEAGANELQAAKKEPELVKEARALCAIDNNVLRSFKDFSENPRDFIAQREYMNVVMQEITRVLGHEPKIKGHPVVRPGLKEVDIKKLIAGEADKPKADVEKLTDWTRTIKASPQPNLISEYNFDVDMPYIADTSGRGMHGVLTAGSIIPGVKGNALHFADRSFVKLPLSESVWGSRPDSGTIALWVKPDTDIAASPNGTFEGYSVFYYAMPKNGNSLPDGYYELGLYEHGPYIIGRCGGVSDCTFAYVPSPLKKNQWTHIAMTWGNGFRRIYFDGKLAAESLGNFELPKMENMPSYIGAHPASNNWFFQGSVDDVKLYNKPLTDPEIAILATE